MRHSSTASLSPSSFSPRTLIMSSSPQPDDDNKNDKKQNKKHAKKEKYHTRKKERSNLSDGGKKRRRGKNDNNANVASSLSIKSLSSSTIKNLPPDNNDRQQSSPPPPKRSPIKSSPPIPTTNTSPPPTTRRRRRTTPPRRSTVIPSPSTRRPRTPPPRRSISMPLSSHSIANHHQVSVSDDEHDVMGCHLLQLLEQHLLTPSLSKEQQVSSSSSSSFSGTQQQQPRTFYPLFSSRNFRLLKKALSRHNQWYQYIEDLFSGRVLWKALMRLLFRCSMSKSSSNNSPSPFPSISNGLQAVGYMTILMLLVVGWGSCHVGLIGFWYGMNASLWVLGWLVDYDDIKSLCAPLLEIEVVGWLYREIIMVDSREKQGMTSGDTEGRMEDDDEEELLTWQRYRRESMSMKKKKSSSSGQQCNDMEDNNILYDINDDINTYLITTAKATHDNNNETHFKQQDLFQSPHWEDHRTAIDFSHVMLWESVRQQEDEESRRKKQQQQQQQKIDACVAAAAAAESSSPLLTSATQTLQQQQTTQPLLPSRSSDDLKITTHSSTRRHDYHRRSSSSSTLSPSITKMTVLNIDELFHDSTNATNPTACVVSSTPGASRMAVSSPFIEVMEPLRRFSFPDEEDEITEKDGGSSCQSSLLTGHEDDDNDTISEESQDLSLSSCHHEESGVLGEQRGVLDTTRRQGRRIGRRSQSCRLPSSHQSNHSSSLPLIPFLQPLDKKQQTQPQQQQQQHQFSSSPRLPRSNSESSLSTVSTSITTGAGSTSSQSCLTTKKNDLNWVDVGTRMGMRLLNHHSQKKQEREMLLLQQEQNKRPSVVMTSMNMSIAPLVTSHESSLTNSTAAAAAADPRMNMRQLQQHRSNSMYQFSELSSPRRRHNHHTSRSGRFELSIPFSSSSMQQITTPSPSPVDNDSQKKSLTSRDDDDDNDDYADDGKQDFHQEMMGDIASSTATARHVVVTNHRKCHPAPPVHPIWSPDATNNAIADNDCDVMSSSDVNYNNNHHQVVNALMSSSSPGRPSSFAMIRSFSCPSVASLHRAPLMEQDADENSDGQIIITKKDCSLQNKNSLTIDPTIIDSFDQEETQHPSSSSTNNDQNNFGFCSPMLCAGDGPTPTAAEIVTKNKQNKQGYKNKYNTPWSDVNSKAASDTLLLPPPLLVPFLDHHLGKHHVQKKLLVSPKSHIPVTVSSSPDDTHTTARDMTTAATKTTSSSSSTTTTSSSSPMGPISRQQSHYEFNAMDFLPVTTQFNKKRRLELFKQQKTPITSPPPPHHSSHATPRHNNNTKNTLPPPHNSSSPKTPQLTQQHSPPPTPSTLSPSPRKNNNPPPKKHLVHIKRRPPLLTGIKMAIPLYPYTAMKFSPKKKKWPHQMATVVSCKRIVIEGYGIPYDNVGEGWKRDVRMPFYERKKRRGREGDGSAATATANGLSVRLQLDKSYLRNGGFAEMFVRIPDESRYVPRHSKFPIGSCVATSFGLGILIGWRVEDDIHVVRSLWQKRGPGSAAAYLNRSSLHGIVEAAVGFDVPTRLGYGKVLAYVTAGRDFMNGRYFVLITESGRHNGHVIEFNRGDLNVGSCIGATFIPVIEHVREAAQFQIQFDTYKAELARRELHSDVGNVFKWSDEIEIVFASLVKAAGENPDFDKEMNQFVTSLIKFLERLDIGQNNNNVNNGIKGGNLTSLTTTDEQLKKDTIYSPNPAEECHSPSSSTTTDDGDLFGWFMSDVFGYNKSSSPQNSNDDNNTTPSQSEPSSTPTTITPITTLNDSSYTRIFSTLRTLTRTLAIARTDLTSRRPNLQLALSFLQETILFITSCLKVRQKNVSPHAAHLRRRTWQRVKETLIPIKNRASNVGKGIVKRLQKHGAKARARCARFLDIVLHDDVLLMALEQGEQYDVVLGRVERAIVKAKILDKDSCVPYRKSLMFIYNALAPRGTNNTNTTMNNTPINHNNTPEGRKIAWFAKALKWLATPRRSLLRLLSRDDVLEVFERILVRVFRHDEDACQTLNVYASSFHTFRHVLMLKNMSVTGKLWIPLLDAADEELAWAVSRMPEQTKEFLEPLSKLFSLGVASVRRLMKSECTGDWMDFLMEDEAVAIIQDLDMKIIQNVETFCNEVKETMVILPYYPSIDEDILNLLDEVDLKVVLREAAEAIVDLDRFRKYVREKSALAVDRFLKYLPKMSIPIERRELGDGWVLTCRGKDGGDLALSDVAVEREKLVCQVMGSENVLSPFKMETGSSNNKVKTNTKHNTLNKNEPTLEETNHYDDDDENNIEVSILDDLRILLLNAQSHGCWEDTVGEPCPATMATALEGIPLSQVLACAVDLWRNLEIDDDELMEIAIRDVSYQIQRQKEKEEGVDVISQQGSRESRMALEHHVFGMQQNSSRSLGSSFVATPTMTTSSSMTQPTSLLPNPSHTASIESFDEFDVVNHRRFNPRVDPTLLYLEMQGMTFHLDEFLFRVEHKERNVLIDPVFEGRGSITIKNVSIRLRVECRKERIKKMGSEITIPVLQLQELDVKLDKVRFKFKETGLDWILNKIVKGFSDSITEIVELHLKEQIIGQIHVSLEHINAFIEVNPDLILGVLGITIDDLEENIVWV